MKINVYRSPDSRLRTDGYRVNDEEFFSVAELTYSGILITEFKKNGEIVNQIYDRDNDLDNALTKHLGTFGKLEFLDVDAYERVKVNVACAKCGTESIERELDRADIGLVSNVPVVPIFVCRKCGSKFYSMSDAYLKHLVEKNVMLFETNEVELKKKDDAKFMNTLQEYIIRIFASKRIQKLCIKG
ncbi:MAG: hypothetical protein ABSD68_03585 [Candidatus Micrarchaeales archaeon]|jgi:hypothetical protein